MKQKQYMLEIVAALLRERSHGRALAAALGTNPMQVSRRLSELEEKNVLDFCIEGKNKRYFLKESSEARAYAIMAEAYLLVQALERYPQLRKIVESIQRNPQLSCALLFGSYAKGKARKDSDIDLYIEGDDRSLKDELGMLDSRLNVVIGRYEKSSPLIQEIERHHVIIKGIEEWYKKSRVFGTDGSSAPAFSDRTKRGYRRILPEKVREQPQGRKDPTRPGSA